MSSSNISGTVNLLWTEKGDSAKGVVLAIDPSLTATGWAVGENERNLVFGDMKNDLRGSERIVWIINRVKVLLHDHKPSVIVLEDYSFGSHTSAYDLGELGGFLRVLFHEYSREVSGVSFLKFAPTELKKFITGKGIAQKELVMLKLFKRFGIETFNNNQADAVGLFLMALLGEKPSVKQKKIRKTK